jgi:hypothetical protein
MPTRVFSQEPDLVAALPRLLQHARRFFAAEVNVLGASPPERSQPLEAFVELRWERARYAGHGVFRITSRPTSPDDHFAADAAEARGRAGGMAELARRCAAVWTITAEGEATGTAELQLSALLASVALGPVLPEDESTLYGVRGAMERAEKAAQS